MKYIFINSPPQTFFNISLEYAKEDALLKDVLPEMSTKEVGFLGTSLIER